MPRAHRPTPLLLLLLLLTGSHGSNVVGNGPAATCSEPVVKRKLNCTSDDAKPLPTVAHKRNACSSQCSGSRGSRSDSAVSVLPSRCWTSIGAGIRVASPCTCTGPHLAVFLHGEALRVGGIHSRRTDGNRTDQTLAFASVYDAIVKPALALSTSSNTWACVSIAASLIAHSAVDAQQALCSDDAGLASGITALRVDQSVASAYDQMDSVLERLRWFLATVSTGCVSPFDALMLVRPDLVFKRVLPVHRDLLVPDMIYAPFRNSDGKLPNWHSNTMLGNPRLADVVLLVPRSRLDDLLCFVATVRRKFRTGMLHYLCDSFGDVGVLWPASRHDSNSHLEWNPLYRMAGRPEAARRNSTSPNPCYDNATRPYGECAFD